MNGKGSRRRPGDDRKFAEGWERAFGKESGEKALAGTTSVNEHPAPGEVSRLESCTPDSSTQTMIIHDLLCEVLEGHREKMLKAMAVPSPLLRELRP